MESKMKAGDLVQSNIFKSNGSGGYGLVMHKCDLPGYWNVWWVGYQSEKSIIAVHGSHDIHEDDIVIVSAGTNK